MAAPILSGNYLGATVPAPVMLDNVVMPSKPDPSETFVHPKHGPVRAIIIELTTESDGAFACGAFAALRLPGPQLQLTALRNALDEADLSYDKREGVAWCVEPGQTFTQADPLPIGMLLPESIRRWKAMQGAMGKLLWPPGDGLVDPRMFDNMRIASDTAPGYPFPWHPSDDLTTIAVELADGSWGCGAFLTEAVQTRRWAVMLQLTAALDTVRLERLDEGRTFVIPPPGMWRDRVTVAEYAASVDQATMLADSSLPWSAAD